MTSRQGTVKSLSFFYSVGRGTLCGGEERKGTGGEWIGPLGYGIIGARDSTHTERESGRCRRKAFF